MRIDDIVAVTPPPVNGRTLITERMIDLIGAGNACVTRVKRPAWTPRAAWPVVRQGLLLSGLLGALASRRRGAIYLVPDSGAAAWTNALLHAPLVRLGGREAVFHHHSFAAFDAPSPPLRLCIRLLGRRLHHIVLCVRMKERLEALYGPQGEIRMLTNAALAPDRPRPHRRRNRLETLGFLGNLSWEKGLGVFMDVVRSLDERHSGLSAVIAGPASTPDIEYAVNTFVAEAPDRRRWLGPVEDDAKAGFFGSIDALLFPSRYRPEAEPVTIHEALAAGTPVLASARGCIPGQLPAAWILNDDRMADDAVAILSAWRGDAAVFRQEMARARSAWDDVSRRAAAERAEIEAFLVGS